MRFKIPPDPTYGEQRIVKRFAWGPTCIRTTVIWLESYWTQEEWIRGGYDELPHWRLVEAFFKEEKEERSCTRT